ncbi:polyprenyl synthetase family protein [Tannerella sp.]|uniref:polyprenyl synthetase family protein n=1 Tax=Tannerella sp. TaxID=2382127 RepID=UPI0026DAAE1F|nr:polyprenyl synthetase family protein [Tannerella sp.]MDO4703619.1 polyprenyl synthetase family protein [Tannerella sp.]
MIDKRDIERPVAKEFGEFRKKFAESLHSEIATIRKAIEAVYHSNGKHIRPLLVLLAAKACGRVTPDSIRAAVFLELLHTASLLHDDVVDDTRRRRGLPSMNALFDNRVAVLVGDFILSEALVRATQTGQVQIVSIIASLSRQMAEGEIKQLENAKEQILKEKDYLIAIEKKTSMLLSACTEIGAITAQATPEIQESCREFGRLLGYCFQIRDDIFDYFDDPSIGKPSGNDIREGKITLPLLYALESADESTKAPFLKMIQKRDFSPENVAALIRFAKDGGGVEYAASRMAYYKEKAADIIRSLPDNEARESLLLLADYVIERKK